MKLPGTGPNSISLHEREREGGEIYKLPYSAKFSRHTIFADRLVFRGKNFADQGNPVSHTFYLCIFAAPDQSTKNVKIMRLENLALYGNVDKIMTSLVT